MRFLTYAGLNPGDLSAKVDKVRAAIERDDLRSPDVKKLNVGPYYRAKLDDGSRLLLQFVSWRGEKACLALEVLRQHAYDRSRFLNGAAVDESKLEEPRSLEAVEAKAVPYLHPTRPHFLLLDKPLSLDDTQEAALHHRTPMVLVGSAGSGKTAILLQRLRAFPGRVAYVTESAWLAQNARRLYGAFDGAPEAQEADFLSHRQLLESVRVPEGRAVTFRDFLGFHARHRTKVPFASAHPLFEEIRGVVTAEPEGPLSKEAYLALGVRQSLFEPAQREAVHELFLRYREWLAASGLYEPNLVAHELLPKVERVYDFVAVDEVQDLTNVQLALVLKTLKTPGEFIVAGDANQVVHPNLFSWSKVRSLFWRGVGESQETDVHVLDVSYRNSAGVTRLSNTLLRLKHARFGSIDKASNNLMRPAHDLAGSVSCLASDAPAVAELDRKTRRSTEACVVVLREEDKAEARRRFGTPLVFSVHEAKGLEYETVVLHRVVSTERKLYAELCEGLSPADLEGDEALAYRRAKDRGDKTAEAWKFFVNALYVAFTRAVRDVVLVEDDPSHPLLALLGVNAAGDTNAIAARQSSTEEWQREAARLEAQGKAEQAEAIRKDVLRLSPVPWTVLDRTNVQALADKALAPGNVSRKAVDQLFDFAVFHHEGGLVERVGHVRGLAVEAIDESMGRWMASSFERERKEWGAKHIKGVLDQVERHGVDFRSPMGLTPLMLAVRAQNLPLVEALLSRGARRDLRDHAGRSALSWLLRGIYADADGRPSKLVGPLYDLLAPPSFDVDVEGRLHQVGRETAEYFLFESMLAMHSHCQTGRWNDLADFRVAWWDRDDRLESWPDVVLKPARRRRAYLSGVLARQEVDSTYPSTKRLFFRVRHGSYWIAPRLKLRAIGPDGAEGWWQHDELSWDEWHRGHGHAFAPVRGAFYDRMLARRRMR
jgi:hypothetical protein